MLVPWVEALVELSLPAPENVVLDLASGTGACAHVLAREIGTTNSTGRVVALDASRGMLEVARERDAALRAAPDAPPLAPVAFDFADACDPDAPWHETRLRAFDRAYCHQGLQHFANPAEALARVRKSLKPGEPITRGAVWAHVDHQPLHRAARDALVDVDKPEWAHILTGPDSDLSWGGDKPRSPVSISAAVAEMGSILVDAGFDAPDAAAERGFAYFDHLEDAAGFVLAEPFGEALRGDETLWRSYVAAFERRLDETAGVRCGSWRRTSQRRVGAPSRRCGRGGRRRRAVGRTRRSVGRPGRRHLRTRHRAVALREEGRRERAPK